VKLLVLALLAAGNLAVASEAEVERKGRVVTTSTTIEILGPITFAPNDAHLAPRHKKMIHAVAQTLLGNPSIRLMEVEGFADRSEAHPDQLGLARATAVMAALVAAGVPTYRLSAASLGATQQLDPSPLATLQDKNRRIEFLIVRRDTAI
jgi:OOP family OmpA-OmpF porin